MRRWSALLLAAVTGLSTTAAISAGSTLASASTSARATASATVTATVRLKTCKTKNLRLRRVTSEGAAGTEYTTYRLKNVGAHRCSLAGYPGVSVRTRLGHLVQQPAAREAGLAPAGATTGRLTLKPGHRVRFVVSAVNVDPDQACPGPRVGSRLRVYPPNRTGALVLTGRFQACELRVGPVFAPA